MFTPSSPSLSKLDDGVAGLGGNTAVVVTVTAHLDVAFHSPSGTPAAEIGQVGETHIDIANNQRLYQ